jgi:intracellular septation protein
LVVFGGMTLALHDPLFIKWKPTVVNWLFAAAFLGWMLVRDETLLQRMLGDAMRLPEAVWRRLNGAWILFFCATGILNLVVAYRFTEPTWVNFKLFGLTGLTLLFILAQGLYLVRHVEEPEAPLAEE